MESLKSRFNRGLPIDSILRRGWRPFAAELMQQKMDWFVSSLRDSALDFFGLPRTYVRGYRVSPPPGLGLRDAVLCLPTTGSLIVSVRPTGWENLVKRLDMPFWVKWLIRWIKEIG